MNLDNFQHYKQVAKLWGREYWLVNNKAPSYCAKLLEIVPGFKCSLHCHKAKTETFIVLDGLVKLRIIHLGGEQSSRLLHTGQSITLAPNEYHQFSSALAGSTAVILEVSSFHDDADVYRLEDSGPC